MKKKLLIQILLWVNLCVMMVACSDDDYIQPDSVPGSCCIEIINSNGDNLLDPNTENNLWEKGNVTIIWNEGEYELNAQTDSGIVCVETPDFGNGPHCVLTFYYIDGWKIFPTDIVMIWGDGSQYTVTYDFRSENVEYRKQANLNIGEGAMITVMTVIID